MASRRNRRVFVLLVIFIGFLLVSAFYWMEANTLPPRWDQSWYLENSERFLTALDVQGFRGFLDTILHAFSGTKAPLISLLPLPFYFIIGHGKLAVELTMLVIIAVFCLVFFRLVRVISGPWEALVAVIILNTMPLAFGLSREYLVEFSLMTLVTLWILLLVYSRGYRVKRYNIGLGIVLGLGLLMKIDFPLYVTGPATYVLYRRWREDGLADSAWIRDLSIICLVGLPMAAIWYLPNLSSVLEFASSMSVGKIPSDYSISFFGAKSLMAFLAVTGQYWNVVINLAVSTYYTIVLAVAWSGSLILIVTRRWFRVISENPIRHAGMEIFLWWFVVTYIVLSLSFNKDYRYGLPALPALGALISLLLFRVLPWPRVRMVALPLVLAFPLVSFIYITYPGANAPADSRSELDFAQQQPRICDAARRSAMASTRDHSEYTR